MCCSLAIYSIWIRTIRTTKMQLLKSMALHMVNYTEHDISKVAGGK